MFKNFPHLDYETHLQEYSHYIKGLSAEDDAYFVVKAQQGHALAVWEASKGLILGAYSLASKVNNESARFHIQLGLGRRTRAIWLAYRKIHSLIPPNRKDPLTIDDAGDASNDLNAIYINICGAFDNFAWALQHLSFPAGSWILKNSQIGLFNKNYLKQNGLEGLKSVVSPFENWHYEFRNRRDPAAHRIPLSIIPSIQDNSSQVQLRAIDEQIAQKNLAAARATHDGRHEDVRVILSESETLYRKREKIGMFLPFFENRSGEAYVPLYPTLPQDMGAYVALSQSLVELISNFGGSKVIQ